MKDEPFKDNYTKLIAHFVFEIKMNPHATPILNILGSERLENLNKNLSATNF